MFHGNKKKEKKAITEEESKSIEEKLNKIKSITEGILKKKEDKDYSEKQLENLLKTSVIMPDFYTLWNYRKDIVTSMKQGMEPSKFYEFLPKELKSIIPVMGKNPKSYVLWFHRIWLLKMAAEYEMSSNILLGKSLLTSEIGLCDNFLMKDERNFHCWNYRMKIFLMIAEYFPAEFPVFLQKELDITINLIKKNFSNFSSWHYRTKIIPYYFKFNNISFQTNESLNYLKDDLEYIKNAIFTAPNEQSCWNYHYWIINNLSPICIESIKHNDNVVTIKFSDIFKIMENSAITLTENNQLVNFNASTIKAFSNKIDIKITGNWDKLVMFYLEIDDGKLVDPPAKCFTKHSVYFPKIIICKVDDKLSYNFELKDEEYKKLLFEFLISQLKIVNELISIEEKDSSFFYEFARYRKAQIETFILFNFYHPLVEVHKADSNLLIQSISDGYKLLVDNSKRLKDMYQILLNNFSDLIKN